MGKALAAHTHCNSTYLKHENKISFNDYIISDCAPNCKYSMNAISKLLTSWRQEQMSKIDTELQRLKTIEKYMAAMDTKFENQLRSEEAKDLEKFQPKGTSSPKSSLTGSPKKTSKSDIP